MFFLPISGPKAVSPSISISGKAMSNISCCVTVCSVDKFSRIYCKVKSYMNRQDIYVTLQVGNSTLKVNYHLYALEDIDFFFPQQVQCFEETSSSVKFAVCLLYAEEKTFHLSYHCCYSCCNGLYYCRQVFIFIYH